VVPLDTQLERIIQVSRTTEQVTLAPGDVLQQVFRTNGGKYSGIVVSSFSEALADRKILVRILEAKKWTRASQKLCGPFLLLTG
jgi:hypothetical protein